MYESSPVTVTVWATFQLLASKVSVDCDSEPWLGSLDCKLTVTDESGWLVKATVNDADAPLSDVVNEVGVTVKPATSVCTLVTVTGVMVRPL